MVVVLRSEKNSENVHCEFPKFPFRILTYCALSQDYLLVVNELERLKKILPLVKIKCKTRDGCCSLQQFFTVMDVAL